MLCLHILQSSLGLINTLMIQDTLALPEWADVLTDADPRGLTPVFHTNMTPYGEIQLRTDRRLDLTASLQLRPDSARHAPSLAITGAGARRRAPIAMRPCRRRSVARFLNPQLERAWDAWQAERYQRGEISQRPSHTDNPFRPR